MGRLPRASTVVGRKPSIGGSWRAARKSLVECAIESYGKLNKHPQNSLDILSWGGVSAELTTEKPVGVPMDLIEKLPV